MEDEEVDENLIICAHCGGENDIDDSKCFYCDSWLSDDEPDELHGWEYELMRYGDVE
jgi:ferredoxin-thioredoxin reductase catalytic subunit